MWAFGIKLEIVVIFWNFKKNFPVFIRSIYPNQVTNSMFMEQFIWGMMLFSSLDSLNCYHLNAKKLVFLTCQFHIYPKQSNSNCWRILNDYADQKLNICCGYIVGFVCSIKDLFFFLFTFLFGCFHIWHVID